jgi:DtxR family transcriptional regulator, Mn-dependent transcriptional regulator
MLPVLDEEHEGQDADEGEQEADDEDGVEPPRQDHQQRERDDRPEQGAERVHRAVHAERYAQTLALRAQRDEGVPRGRPDALAGSVDSNDGGDAKPGTAGGEHAQLGEGRQPIAKAGHLLVTLPAVSGDAAEDAHQCADAVIQAVDDPEGQRRDAQRDDEIDRQHRGDHLRGDVGQHADQAQEDHVGRDPGHQPAAQRARRGAFRLRLRLAPGQGFADRRVHGRRSVAYAKRRAAWANGQGRHAGPGVGRASNILGMAAKRRESDTPELSQAAQGYLLTLRSMAGAGVEPKAAALARRMGVSAQAASEMIQRLAHEGMVVVGPERELRLTQAGREAADTIFRRHSLLEWLLTRVIGLGWAESDEEAARLQGALSPRVEERLAQLLGNPPTCPHGNPIDSHSARTRPRGTRLSDVEAGSEVTIYRITEEAEEDVELLTYLEQGGLVPGALASVVEVSHGRDSLTIDGPRGRSTMGLRPAALIRVLPGRADPGLFHKVPPIAPG